MQRVIHTAIFILLPIWVASGQDLQGSREGDYREQVYLHLNDDLLISGERLRFAAHVVSEKSQLPSRFSSILYVELIGENEVVFRQKIALEDGRGSGTFFIPSTVETGVYHLIAYTRWMRNFNDYYHAELTLINPFENYENPAPDEEKPHLFPRSYAPVSDIPNYFHLHLPGDRNWKTIRLTDQEGPVEAEIKVENNRCYAVAFTPRPESSYRVIAEDAAGTLSFISLPPSRPAGTQLLLRENDSGPQLGIQSTSPGVSLLAEDIYGKTDILTSGDYLLLSPAYLHEGPYHVDVQDASGNIIMSGTLGPTTPPVSRQDAIRASTSDSLRVSLDLPPGSYSFSVKKQMNPTDIAGYPALSSDDRFVRGDFGKSSYGFHPFHEFHREAVKKFPVFNQQEVTFLPETGTGILTGHVSGLLSGRDVLTLTVPGHNTRLQTARVDSSGNFTLLYPVPHTDVTAVFGTQTAIENLEVELDGQWIGHLLDFPFDRPYLDSALVVTVLDRSRNLQINNSFQLDPLPQEEDTVRLSPVAGYDRRFILDEYNRFPTLGDHFIEYIPNVGVRREQILIRIGRILPGREYPPLILLDGVPVDPGKILEFNPYKVRTIATLANRYYHGLITADGVIDMETFEGEMSDYDAGSSVVYVPLQGLSMDNAEVSVNRPTHPDENIPDRRETLAFHSEIRVTRPGIVPIPVYTSEVTGTFIWHLEGFTEEGEAFSMMGEIEVRE